MLTDVWNKYKNTNKTYEHLKVIRQNTFYLFGDGILIKEECFHDTGDIMKNMSNILTDQAYGVHLNSKVSGLEMSKSGPLKKGTICKNLLNDFCVLCNEMH